MQGVKKAIFWYVAAWVLLELTFLRNICSNKNHMAPPWLFVFNHKTLNIPKIDDSFQTRKGQIDMQFHDLPNQSLNFFNVLHSYTKISQ
jgi:hypothetical protein